MKSDTGKRRPHRRWTVLLLVSLAALCLVRSFTVPDGRLAYMVLAALLLLWFEVVVLSTRVELMLESLILLLKKLIKMGGGLGR